MRRTRHPAERFALVLIPSMGWNAVFRAGAFHAAEVGHNVYEAW